MQDSNATLYNSSPKQQVPLLSSRTIQVCWLGQPTSKYMALRKFYNVQRTVRIFAAKTSD